jgi:hypothetical protein
MRRQMGLVFSRCNSAIVDSLILVNNRDFLEHGLAACVRHSNYSDRYWFACPSDRID